MSARIVLALALVAWALVTAGVALAFRSWAVVPISAGVTLGAVCWIYGRALYASALLEAREGGRR